MVCVIRGTLYVCVVDVVSVSICRVCDIYAVCSVRVCGVCVVPVGM